VEWGRVGGFNRTSCMRGRQKVVRGTFVVASGDWCNCAGVCEHRETDCSTGTVFQRRVSQMHGGTP